MNKPLGKLLIDVEKLDIGELKKEKIKTYVRKAHAAGIEISLKELIPLSRRVIERLTYKLA